MLAAGTAPSQEPGVPGQQSPVLVEPWGCSLQSKALHSPPGSALSSGTSKPAWDPASKGMGMQQEYLVYWSSSSADVNELYVIKS